MLTPKQRKFSEEYLLDLNGTQAAIRSGYSAKTAAAIAEENLRKPEIQAQIFELQLARSQRTEITADQVLLELERIAFSNVADVVQFGSAEMQIKSSSDLPKDVTAAISDVQVVVTESDRSTRVSSKVRMHDKLRALELLSRHLGMLSDFNQAIATLATYGVHLKQTEQGWMVEQ